MCLDTCIFLSSLNTFRMKKVIAEKLREIEKRHNVTILFACESGSRAWGFPSPDSDYDVRFVYLHQPEWYVTIRERNEVIELPVNETLDINGWDFKKTLLLLAKSNAVLFEWMQSPIFYTKNEKFLKQLSEAAKKCFSPIAAMHHYLSMSKKHYDECTASDEVKLKKYFYALRATLSCEWIARRNEVPPMELKKLMDIIKNRNKLANKIEKLVAVKAAKTESYYHGREKLLDAYLQEAIARCEEAAPKLPANKTDKKTHILTTFTTILSFSVITCSRKILPLYWFRSNDIPSTSRWCGSFSL